MGAAALAPPICQSLPLVALFVSVPPVWKTRPTAELNLPTQRLMVRITALFWMSSRPCASDVSAMLKSCVMSKVALLRMIRFAVSPANVPGPTEEKLAVLVILALASKITVP